jgi:hypothetical protein
VKTIQFLVRVCITSVTAEICQFLSLMDTIFCLDIILLFFIGTAFFPLQSCMNHSCCPNAKAFKRDEVCTFSLSWSVHFHAVQIAASNADLSW